MMKYTNCHCVPEAAFVAFNFNLTLSWPSCNAFIGIVCRWCCACCYTNCLYYTRLGMRRCRKFPFLPFPSAFTLFHFYTLWSAHSGLSICVCCCRPNSFYY